MAECQPASREVKIGFGRAVNETGAMEKLAIVSGMPVRDKKILYRR